MYAHTLRTVLSRPSRLTGTGLSVEAKDAMVGAVRETLEGLIVRLRAVPSLPTLLAHAVPIETEAVGGAGRMWTVNWKERDT
jgi:hypothetical protein